MSNIQQKKPSNKPSKKPAKLSHEAELKATLSSLAGLTCYTTNFSEAGTLIICIDDHPFNTLGEARWRLWLDCAWRMEFGHKIAVGYCDSDETVLEELRKIHGKKVILTKFISRTRDLSIHFENGFCIKGFTNSIQNEQWELRGSDGLRIGIKDGLKIVKDMLTKKEN